MHFKTFKVPNAGRDWAASGTLHYIGMLHEIFTFLLMEYERVEAICVLSEGREDHGHSRVVVALVKGVDDDDACGKPRLTRDTV